MASSFLIWNKDTISLTSSCYYNSEAILASGQFRDGIVRQPFTRFRSIWCIVRIDLLSISIFLLNLHFRGWACVKEALEFPTPSSFKKVTGLTNRPLSIEDSHLPKDERIQLVSGIDLTGTVDSVFDSMKQKIKDIDTVTHVIFTAYIEKPDFESLRTVNTDLLKVAATAVDKVAPKLQAFVLQTGGKSYGVEFSDKLEIKPPLKESQPRIPKPCKCIPILS